MGSDGKEMKKKSGKRSSTLSSSEDEGKSRKRHRSGEEEERRSRKSDKKEKKKDKRSHRHQSDKGSEKKSKDKHKSKRHKGDRNSKSDFQEISNDDYFLKNNEFATWLKEKKKTFFSDLSSESARELFSDFVKDWNNEKLDSRYYEGIASGPRCAHNWTFKK